MTAEISLNFMPAFYNKHLGLSYGEAYYFDPGHRESVEKAESRFLYESLGRYGVGSPDPEPTGVLSVQPVDLILRTQGARWRFPEAATVESIGEPWAGLTPEEISRIDAREAAHHPIIDSLLEQYAEMSRLYGDKADILWSKSGMMNIHTPHTTAHQLCGEEWFVMLIAEPEDARIVMDKIWEIYRAIYARVAEVTGVRFRQLALGDCAASLLSEKTYREVVMPVNVELACGFDSICYHSCGSSSHLVKAFAGLPRVERIQLGPGTNMADATRLMPETMMQPIIDPLLMRNASPEQVQAAIVGTLADTRESPGVIFCAWSFDRETPIENVAAMYETVRNEAA